MATDDSAPKLGLVPEDQMRLASSLAEWLSEELPVDCLSTADVLDALASLGCKLTRDPAGEASAAYVKMMTEEEF